MSQKSDPVNTEQTGHTRIKWTSEKIMSISALFISVISVIALIYQSYLSREENRLIQQQQSAAVLPHLNQWYSNVGDSFKFVIGNKGVGPAFIDDVDIMLDSTHRFNNTKDLFVHIFNNTRGLDTIPYTYSTLIKGSVLPANEELNLLEVKNAKNIGYIRMSIARKQIEYSIIYKDVYGSKWMLTNKNQDNSSTSVPIQIE